MRNIDPIVSTPEPREGALGWRAEDRRRSTSHADVPEPVRQLADALAKMEGTEAACCTGSGAAAVAATLLQLCETEGWVVASSHVGGGAATLLRDYLPRRAGIRTRFLDPTNLGAVESAMKPGTQVLFVESTHRADLGVLDLPSLASIAHHNGAKLVVDNTCSPLLVSPALHGADVVVHELSAFVGGGADHLCGGVICGGDAFIEGLMSPGSGSLVLLGSPLDPRDASDLSQRLPHLGLRIAEHCVRAMTFAWRLRERGVSVSYPGLPPHQNHGLYSRLSNTGYGYGAVLDVDAKTEENAFAIVDILQARGFGSTRVLPGHHQTALISASTAITERQRDEVVRARLANSAVRLSVGYGGSLEERWAELESAMRHVHLI